MKREIRLTLVTLCLLVWPATVVLALGIKSSVPMKTIEGRVVAVERSQGEGDVEVILARIQTADGGDTSTPILLAPESVCDQIGFEIEEGARLRARVFVTPDGPAPVQKVQNFTRGTMIRMRTLHTTPLWSGNGTWQGGPVRTARGHDRAGQGGGKRPPR